MDLSKEETFGLAHQREKKDKETAPVYRKCI